MAKRDDLEAAVDLEASVLAYEELCYQYYTYTSQDALDCVKYARGVLDAICHDTGLKSVEILDEIERRRVHHG